ncbi:hypothetical protein Plim_0420 [Planctopirus limnophila DSM 3776]|uniref:Uncharacterized protein n=1 Tax=Planctopirus limnophila (strain ATCC 43296 / DSM 3776 / IFAM 1008 / Mu 290) TaxID=521674 RepID=D5SPP0_PLAL2|nr:hypothetical protein Plim_0420 [Planctopirus limnophila DSM 3776]
MHAVWPQLSKATHFPGAFLRDVFSALSHVRLRNGDNPLSQLAAWDSSS